MVDYDDSEEQWRRELSSLDIEDILNLCYTFRTSKERLILYLDVLRGRGGQKAQFASSLICFDLARQGMESFQREFMALAPTIFEMSANQALIDSFINQNDYLSFLWELCSAQLEEMDDGEAETADFFGEETEEISLDLFEDDDLVDLDFDVDNQAMFRNFQWALADYLGYDPDTSGFDFNKGFRFSSKRDTARLENLIKELDSLREFIPQSNGLRAVALLFYAANLKNKDFWGRINTKKEELMKEALYLFRENPQHVFSYIELLTGPLADDDAWVLVAKQLEHFVRWTYLHDVNWKTQLHHYKVNDDLPPLDI